MKEKISIYSFGQCPRCEIHTALKDGICYNCKEKDVFKDTSFPDIFRDIFGKFKEKK